MFYMDTLFHKMQLKTFWKDHERIYNSPECSRTEEI
jgi:hypothetical protein